MISRPSTIAVLAALALAGCGEEQAAQNENRTTTAQAPATTAPATTAPAAPATTSNTAAPAPAPTTTGAVATGPMQQVVGKSYTAGPIALRLDQNGTFEMRETEGSKRVEGKYAVQDGVVTFSDPNGDIGGASFPMRCRFEGTATEFKLGDVENSCVRLKDLTFKPAA
jgi:hypothetical protein